MPEDEVRDFFGRFSEGAFEIGDYKAALAESRFVAGIAFEVHFDSIDRGRRNGMASSGRAFTN